MSKLLFLRDLVDTVLSAAGGDGIAPPAPPAVPGGGAAVSPPEPLDVIKKGSDLAHPKLPKLRPFGPVGPALDAIEAMTTLAEGTKNVHNYNKRKRKTLDDILDSRGEVQE